jgi:hypothetical protein
MKLGGKIRVMAGAKIVVLSREELSWKEMILILILIVRKSETAMMSYR